MPDKEELKNLLNDLEGKPNLSLVPEQSEEVKVVHPMDNIAEEMVTRFKSKFDLMCEREKDDRKDLRKVITYLEGLVLNSHNPKSAWLEQLVGAYRVLMDSNSNQTRALDALSKLLTAGKGTQVMINNNVGETSNQEELLKLLEE